MKILTMDTSRIKYKLKVLVDLAYELTTLEYGTKEYEKAEKNHLRYSEVKHTLTYIFNADFKELLQAFFSNDEAEYKELYEKSLKSFLIHED